MIQPSDRRIDLIYAINIILDCNENENENVNEKMCMYKMYLILAEGYKNANVEFLTIRTTSEIWVSLKDVGSGIGVKNISDLVLKEIYGICETQKPSKEQVNEYKMTKREIYKNFTNLGKQELNKKIIIKLMSKMMLWQLLLNAVEEKTRDIRAIDGFRQRLMIPDSENLWIWS